MWSAISANYTNEVVEDMEEYGIWDADTQDVVADELLQIF